MSKGKKALDKLTGHPRPGNLKWAELTAALGHLGYEMLPPGSGSGRKFYNKEVDALICCHKPHPSPDVDKGCIADIVEHLKAKGLI